MDSKVAQLFQPSGFEESRTKAGSKVRIYTRNGDRLRPIHGVWHEKSEDRWYPAAWLKSGHYLAYNYDSSLDLVEAIQFEDRIS